MRTTFNAETAETAEKTSRALFEYSCILIRFAEQTKARRNRCFGL